MPVYEEVLNIAHQNVQQLGDQLNELNEIKRRLQVARRIPDQWDEKFKEIAATTREYTSAINQVANTYLEDSNTVIGNNLAAFDAASTKLNGQIDTLIEYDFASHFKSLQQEVAQKVKADLQLEINRVREATSDLAGTYEAFEQQITRLNEFDLEAHFNRHQKMLSDVFNAINSINSLLSTNTQTIVQMQTEQSNLKRFIEESYKNTQNAIAVNAKMLKSLRTILYVTIFFALIGAALVMYVTFIR